jgi:L-ascorbate 6-phosphate lactonase
MMENNMSINSNFLEQVEAHTPTNAFTIWALGGPSTIIQTPETTVYLDLFTGPSPETTLHKATVDIVDPAAIRRVDATLSTHHDPDHCHQPSLTPIHNNTDALLIGPRSCTKLFREWGFDPNRMVELGAHQAFQFKDLRIWAMPCNDYFDPDAVSYVFQSGGVTLFDGGDTLYYSGYIEVGRQFDIDVALLNFARNPPGEIYYMNHAHVARTAQELGARILIPKHFDLWEEFLDDPAPLVEMLEPAGISVEILAQGAHFSI